MSKSIAHVIKHSNFQVCRAYSAEVIWKNRQLTTNIYIYKKTANFYTSNKICFQNNMLTLFRIGSKKTPMANRRGTAPTKHSLYIPLSLANHEKNPQLPPYQAKVFHLPPFCIFFFFAFFQVPSYWRTALAMPPTIFSNVKVRISSQSFVTFSFNSFATPL